MPDEVNYEAHLLSFEQTKERVPGPERRVLEYAWEVYCLTIETNDQIRQRQTQVAQSEQIPEPHTGQMTETP